jgi:hypothetical protein
MIAHSNNDIAKFEAGRIKHYIRKWMESTSDPFILNIIRHGYKLEFVADPPIQRIKPSPINFKPEEAFIMDQEVQTQLGKKLITECTSERGEFISKCFLRQKPDGSYRMIIDLSNLNKHLEYAHFKMEGLKTVSELLTPGCYQGTVDIKDAYYSVPKHKDFQKYLRFEWKGKMHQFTCFQNVLAPCPRI